jgi:protoporphyrinogen oxidase
MRIAIIGAGATGLPAAYDLAGAGHDVVVYEAGEQVGGLAAGFKADHWDWTLEKFYHHWFRSDAHILRLADDLGCRDKVIFPRPVTAVYYEGKFYPFDSPRSWITFPGFSWLDVVRFGLCGAFLRFFPDGQRLEKYTADEWLPKWMGRRPYELLWKPLLIGKFGEENYRRVNLAWFWARIKARTPRLGTFEGGFQAFLDILADACRARGVEIRLETPIDGITTHPDGGLVVATPTGSERFDQVIATTSPRALAKMAPELPADYREQLLALRSLGAVVMVIALEHKLTDYYWFNLPKDADFPYLAMVEHTNFIPPEHYGGDHIIYCGDYLATDHPYFAMPGRAAGGVPAVAEELQPQLRSLVGEAEMAVQGAVRAADSVPQPLQNIPDVATPIDGLWLASMSQVYPWDRGTNFAVELGRKVAGLVNG